MDLHDFGSTLARWWSLTLATLMLAIGAGYAAYQAAGPSYTATSTVLLLPPKAVLLQQAQDERNYAPNNPLLYLGTLSDTRDVLVRHLSSNEVVERLEKAAPGAEVTVEGDPTSQSPLILVESQADTEAGALQGIKSLNDMVPGTLKTFQDDMNIAALQRVTSINVTVDRRAEADNKTQIELAVVSAVGVTVLGLALIALLDQLRNRRRRTTHDARPVVTTGEPVETVVDRHDSGATPATQSTRTGQDR